MTSVGAGVIAFGAGAGAGVAAGSAAGFGGGAAAGEDVGAAITMRRGGGVLNARLCSGARELSTRFEVGVGAVGSSTAGVGVGADTDALGTMDRSAEPDGFRWLAIGSGAMSAGGESAVVAAEVTEARYTTNPIAFRVMNATTTPATVFMR